jgi:DNA-binding transcriptional LysR family regulator
MGKKTIDRRWLPLNALRAFEGVAKHGSFTAAANALLISQSALSRHVIALERLTGVQLFDRKPHALMLTKAGQHLLPAVVKSFDRLEYALDDIRNDGAPTQRTLRVQMPPSFAVQLAVPILRDAWRCRRGGRVLQAYRDGSRYGSIVAGALEYPVSPQHRGPSPGQGSRRLHRGE